MRTLLLLDEFSLEFYETNFSSSTASCGGMGMVFWGTESFFLYTVWSPLEPAELNLRLSRLCSSKKSLSSSSNHSGSGCYLLAFNSSRSTTELVSESEEESKFY
jgi:hypothetical protein